MTSNTPPHLVGQCHRCGGYLTAVPYGVICQFCGQTREMTERERESMASPPEATR